MPATNSGLQLRGQLRNYLFTGFPFNLLMIVSAEEPSFRHKLKRSCAICKRQTINIAAVIKFRTTLRPLVILLSICMMTCKDKREADNNQRVSDVAVLKYA